MVYQQWGCFIGSLYLFDFRLISFDSFCDVLLESRLYGFEWFCDNFFLGKFLCALTHEPLTDKLY